MTGLLDTIQRERAGRGPTASLATAPSFPAAFDAHQRGRASYRVLSRGHHVHVVSNQPKKGFFTVTPPGLLTLPPVDWRRFCRRPFPHSHRPGFPPSRRRAFRGLSLLPGFRGARQSIRATGSRRSRAHSLPAEQFLQSLAHRDHHSIVLFHGCAVREVSCATKGLGNVRKAFGELRNV